MQHSCFSVFQCGPALAYFSPVQRKADHRLLKGVELKRAGAAMEHPLMAEGRSGIVGSGFPELDFPGSAMEGKTGNSRKNKKGKRDDELSRRESSRSSSSPLLHFHALLLIGGRILSKVLELYGSLFDLSPKDKAKIYRNLSIHHLKKGERAKAVGLLKEWMRLEPSNPEASYQLANALVSVGNYRSALGVIGKTLRLDEKYKGALYRKGTIQIKLKNYEEAAEAFERFVESHPHHAKSYYLLAITYDHTGRTEKAVEALEKAVQIQPQMVHYYQHLGFLYERIGDRQKAVGCFSKMIELEQQEDEEN